MAFNRREWVKDIATGTLSGMLTGTVGALFVPDQPFGVGAAVGGILGLVDGLLNQLIRSLLEGRQK